MTEVLHKLIDSGAQQPVINERVAGLLESHRKDLERIGTDHEKRLRYVERTIAWALGGIGAISTLAVILEKVIK